MYTVLHSNETGLATVSVTLQFPATSHVATEKIHPSKKKIKKLYGTSNIMRPKSSKNELGAVSLPSLSLSKSQGYLNFQGQKKRVTSVYCSSFGSLHMAI